VEAWELDRAEIVIDEPKGGDKRSKRDKGKGGKGPQLKTCKWRGLECVAKILDHNHKQHEFSDMMEELSYVSRLRHPNLVLFLGAVTTSSPLIILTEFMSLGSLEDHVERTKVHNRNTGAKHAWLPDRKIVFRWCIDLAKALSFLHSCVPPVPHRALQPSKLLLSEDLHLKVSDFGMSKTLQLDDKAGNPVIRSSSGHCWQAPELLRGDVESDYTVDLYSMGMIYWFIMNGERPYSHLPQNTVSHAVCELQQRPSLDAIQDQYGWEVVVVMGRLWEQEPELRMKAEEVVDEMEKWQRRPSVEKVVGGVSAKKRHGGLSPGVRGGGSQEGSPLPPGSPKACAIQ